MIAACGMACEICGLKSVCGGCPPGTDLGAKDRSDELERLLGFRCPAFECAVEKHVDYCLNCESFPCDIHYRFNYPYSDLLLDTFKAMREHRTDFGSDEFRKEMLRIAMQHRKSQK